MDLCKEVLSESDFLLQEIKYFHLDRESMNDLRAFFLSYGIKTKVAVCIIDNPEKAIVSGFLKIFEDVKDQTKIIMIANNVPEVLQNRAITVEVVSQTLSPAKVFLESFQKKLINFYLRRDYDFAMAGYQTHEKLLDFYTWMRHNKIKPQEAVERMESLIRCAGLGEEFL